ncbi:hypothetical protein LTR85_011784 [Meristemomyces frigidus]|nr:hypothetical protein LTR85_011784 [Meristemomyces frigidus]
MSDVSTKPAFVHRRTWNLTNAEGISEFNSSHGPLIAIQADRIFSNSITTFLSNNEITVDITPDKLKVISCHQMARTGETPTCEREVFMPGAIPIGLVTQDGYPEADIAMTFALKGYVLRYGPGDGPKSWEFDEGSCMTDKSWHRNTNESTTTTLRTSFRWADVAFHRANASIAWHNFLDIPEQEAPIRAPDLLAVFDDFALGTQSFVQMFYDWSSALGPDTATDIAGDSSTGDALSDAIDSLIETPDELSNSRLRTHKRQSESDNTLDATSLLGGLLGSLASSMPGSNPIFPIVPFAYMDACFSLGKLNPGAIPICTDFLQNFLAIPLYWCDALLPTRANSGGLDLTDPFTQGENGSSGAELDAFLAYVGLDDASKRRIEDGTGVTKVALSRLRYEIDVGRPSLIVYTVVTGTILLFCIAALAAGSRETISPSSWPLLDFLLKMTLFSCGHYFTQAEREIVSVMSEEDQRDAIGRISVKAYDTFSSL